MKGCRFLNQLTSLNGKIKMESLAILSPTISTRLVSSGPRSVCLKVQLSHNRSGVQQSVDTLCHRWCLKKLDSLATQPLISLPVSWQVFAATLEGDMELDSCSIGKNESGETVQISQDQSKNVLDASKQSQERWQGKKYAPWVRKNITVGLDALQPGAILTGKVTNMEKFGAFVDVGAFTNGLIHISNLSNKFVNSVEDIVKVGQEVRVEVLNVDVNLRRLSLKLVREEEPPKVEKPILLTEPPEVQKRIPTFIDKKSSSNSAGRPQKGEVVTGSVTKIASSGVFVTLNQGHQGFLPASEVLSSGHTVETTSFFRVGQQIPVRVLRTSKDRITLSMKKQENANENRVVTSTPEDRATSPFEIAFRRNKVIAKYLEERERLQNISIGKTDENPVIQSTTEINQS